jgi:hypothetical protein
MRKDPLLSVVEIEPFCSLWSPQAKTLKVVAMYPDLLV